MCDKSPFRVLIPDLPQYPQVCLLGIAGALYMQLMLHNNKRWGCFYLNQNFIIFLSFLFWLWLNIITTGFVHVEVMICVCSQSDCWLFGQCKVHQLDLKLNIAWFVSFFLTPLLSWFPLASAAPAHLYYPFNASSYCTQLWGWCRWKYWPSTLTAPSNQEKAEKEEQAAIVLLAY